MKGVDSKLVSNTLMLYTLTASNYLFGLATIPYLTRVLGAEQYGRVGFATAFSTYVQLVLDFGFLLSATASVSRCNGDRDQISRVMSAVTIAKISLIAIAGMIVAILVWNIRVFSSDKTLFMLYFIYVSVNSLIPDYVYRGMEVMSVVTARTVTVKATFLVLMLLFVRCPSDYILVPLFYLLGAFVAVMWVSRHMRQTLGVRFTRVSAKEILYVAKESASFFISRIASTFYGSMNTMVLGFVYSGSAVLGHYSACNNVVSAGRLLASPIADSMYPYMLRTKNSDLLERVVLAGEAVLIPVCIVAGITAPHLCEFLFGLGYSEAGTLLRAMLPLIPISLASYIFGFPALAPINREDVANRSVVIGAFVQVFLLFGLYITGRFTAVSMCYATVITELIVLGMRISTYISWRRHQM